ncbi:nonsense-mediated mRNA decay protein 2 isoform X3 [Papaver somniferum]|uniref:nonsense-mediated mRNA decay protein 2 isoform X3 n=1 Tax=Papaver somniferum TaxID=3469 RepID=UPI000E6F9933|nr:nonsense-mediated mRNA decay protein 2 isoform X3 [Papaver somniferum]
MAASQNLVLKSFSCNSLGYYLQTRFPFHCPPPSCISQNLKSFHNHGRIFITHAKKKRNSPLVREEEQQVDEDIVAELEEDDDDDDDGFDDFEDEDGEFSDDDDFDEDLYESDEGELYVGDGGGGGGISLAGSTWDKEALAIAEEVSSSLDGDLKIYAFKTLVNSTIRVRIEKLSNKSSSPTMADIEAFSSAYRARLDEAEEAGSVPKNVSLEPQIQRKERMLAFC